MSVARPLFLKGMSLLGIAGLAAACASPAEPSRNIQSASIKPTPTVKPCDRDEFVKAKGYPTVAPLGGGEKETNIPKHILLIGKKLETCQELSPEEVAQIPPFNLQHPPQGEVPTQVPPTATSTETPVPPTATKVPTLVPPTATVAQGEKDPNPQTEWLKRDGVYKGDVFTVDGGIKKGTLFLYRFSNVQMIASFALAEDFTGDPGGSNRAILHYLLRSSSTSSKDFIPADQYGNKTKDALSVSIVDSALTVNVTPNVWSAPPKMTVPSMIYAGDGVTVYLNGLSAAIDKVKLHFSDQQIRDDIKQQIKIQLP